MIGIVRKIFRRMSRCFCCFCLGAGMSFQFLVGPGTLYLDLWAGQAGVLLGRMMGSPYVQTVHPWFPGMESVGCRWAKMVRI